jgi:phosphatidate phosphatase PAH1
MPANLPAPYTAPFWMKVGDAGEAFFVLETDEEVPEELMTSPVISAADVRTLAKRLPWLMVCLQYESHVESDPKIGATEDDAKTDLNLRDATQQPFGKNDLKASANVRCCLCRSGH